MTTRVQWLKRRFGRIQQVIKKIFHLNSSHISRNIYLLMSEMSLAGHHHRQIMFFTIGNRIFITDASAGLNEGSNPCFMPHSYTIVKWEKRITGQDGTICIRTKLPGFFQGLASASIGCLACLSIGCDLLLKRGVCLRCADKIGKC
jgi:hypothetical protein